MSTLIDTQGIYEGLDRSKYIDINMNLQQTSNSNSEKKIVGSTLNQESKKYCKCGCNQKIIIKPWHKTYGIPRYIVGHNQTGKTWEESLGVEKAIIRKKRLSERLKGAGNPNFGRPYSDEYRKNISESLTGRKLSEEHRLNIVRSRIGKKHSEETIKKMSEQRFGKNNPGWKGGTTPLYKKIWKSSKMKSWRKAIFERDDYTCQECGTYSGILHSHHIRKFSAYPLLRFDINNGITLCYGCHTNIKKREEQLILYFTKKIEQNTIFSKTEKQRRTNKNEENNN